MCAKYNPIKGYSESGTIGTESNGSETKGNKNNPSEPPDGMPYSECISTWVYYLLFVLANYKLICMRLGFSTH